MGIPDRQHHGVATVTVTVPGQLAGRGFPHHCVSANESASALT